MHPCLRVATPASSLQTSYSGIPPSKSLHLHQACSTRFWRDSRALELYTSVTSRRHTCSALPTLQRSNAPTLHTPSSARAEHASGALYLSLNLHARHPHDCIAPPAVPTSIPPRLPAYIPPPDLHSSMLPRRYTCGAPPDLYSSVLPRRYTRSAAPELQSSGTPYLRTLYACSSPPALQNCIHPYFHVATPSSSLQTSIYSITTRLQHASKDIELNTSMLPRLHDYSVPLELQSSRP